ncbi:MAG: biopolymer transporter ExbD [Xanthomonadales bacterium]|nr:biopolymer transporter ExbD [Xanthomonadales bacterium]
MKRRHHPDDEAEINITPMLDIVFIMLIFFIVTTSFVKEKGLDLARPEQSKNQKVDKDKLPIVVMIDATSVIRVSGRVVEPNAVRANLEREHAQKPDALMILAMHPDAHAESMVNVLDGANIVGIQNVSVATEAR